MLTQSDPSQLRRIVVFGHLSLEDGVQGSPLKAEVLIFVVMSLINMCSRVVRRWIAVVDG